MRGPFGRIANAFEFHDLASAAAGAFRAFLANKKVGSRPLGHATGFNLEEYSGGQPQKQAGWSADTSARAERSALQHKARRGNYVRLPKPASSARPRA